MQHNPYAVNYATEYMKGEAARGKKGLPQEVAREKKVSRK